MEKPLTAESTLQDAVRSIENTMRRIAVVVNDKGSVEGTLTDGDVRRRLLANGNLQDSVVLAMNASPLTAPVNSSNAYRLSLLEQANIEALPLIDTEGKYVRLFHLIDSKVEPESTLEKSGFSLAVIMAGGEGRRLRPITKNIPKPMVEINGLPLLERQIARLFKAGIRDIFISTNYLSNIIEDYFGDGSKFNVNISYLRETKKLGTAGALSLLPDTPKKPILVMNGDILTTSDFGHFCKFHREHQALVSVAAVKYRVDIPYGVIRSQGAQVIKLDEKPSQQFFCNAGIYAISPEILASIDKDTFLNMTDIIESCLKDKQNVAVFPMHEYWSDIGTPSDLEKAREEFCALESYYH